MSALRNSFTSVVALTLALTAPAAAQDLVVTNAVVLDPATKGTVEGTILVREGRIAAVGADVVVPEGIEVMDAAGRYVVPGLFDMHTHSFGNLAPSGTGQMLGAPGVAKLALYTGVVGFLDLFSMEDMILRMRDRQRAEGLPGADIYASGPCLTATNGHCSEYGVPTRIVDSPEDARVQIGELAPKDPDVIKLVYDNQTYSGRSMPTVDKATLEAVVATAHEHGFKAVIHVGTWQDVRDAVEAGADAVTHTPGPEAPPADLVALMAERGTVHIPTLGVQSELGRIADDPSVLDRPLLAAVVSETVVDSYRDAESWPAPMQGFREWTRTLRQPNLEAVRALAEGGVRIGTGTDGGNPGIFQGYSVHREIEFLVEAGLSEWDALAAATTVPAEFLERDWGVHLGAEATFIVLDASPLDNIVNTQSIHAVIQRGATVDREALR